MSPSTRFRGQPFLDGDTAGDFLREALTSADLSSLSVVVAWARFGGLSRLESEISAFRERGGKFRIVLGIDEGGATRPGLKLAIRLADEAYVFHDRTARTFHPKIYLAEGSTRAVLLVGSSNMTAGGLFSNYEASLEAEFGLPDEAEAEGLVGAREYIAKLLADERLCLRLDDELLDRLAEDPRYAISKGERRQRGSRAALPEGTEDGETDQHGGGGPGSGPGLFGASAHGKTHPPALSQSARAALDDLEAEAGADIPEVLPASAEQLDPPTVELEWVREDLGPSNVEQSESNQIGALRLAAAGNEIPWQTWFRHDLFGSEAWVEGRDREGNPKEIATIPFEVTIDGSSHGVIDLEVSHAPHREAEQGNVPTNLHWKGDLAPLLRATDYSGYTLTLQRMSDGTFRLEISP